MSGQCLGRTLVAQGTMATVVVEVRKENVAEVGHTFLTLTGECYIYLAVLAHLIYICTRAHACAQVAEHLRVVEESAPTVVYDYLETEVGLLPHKDVHLSHQYIQ